MKRAVAVRRCWCLINAKQYREANRLMLKQRRVHGRRLFSYWLRLHVANGLWEIDGL